MEIKNILKPECIVFNLKGKTKEEVIVNLSRLLAEHGFVTDVDAYTDAVFAREAQSTTGIGNGIAIPHGKSPAVVESVVVFAKTEQGIEWEALDEKPVNIVFLLAISDGEQIDRPFAIIVYDCQQING